MTFLYLKVIGENIVTRQAIIYLLVKLRITPAGHEQKEKKELSADEVKKAVQKEAAADEKFLASASGSRSRIRKHARTHQERPGVFKTALQLSKTAAGPR